jgi:hypothetical protein
MPRLREMKWVLHGQVYHPAVYRVIREHGSDYLHRHYDLDDCKYLKCGVPGCPITLEVCHHLEDHPVCCEHFFAYQDESPGWPWLHNTRCMDCHTFWKKAKNRSKCPQCGLWHRIHIPSSIIPPTALCALCGVYRPTEVDPGFGLLRLLTLDDFSKLLAKGEGSE